VSAGRARGTRLWPVPADTQAVEKPPPVPKHHHGTIYRYRLEAARYRSHGGTWGKPCKECTAAYKAYRARTKANALARGDQGQFKHGTEYGYKTYKCKCDKCVAWGNWKRGNAKRKAAGRPLIPWREDRPTIPPLWVLCERAGCGSRRTFPFIGGTFCEAHRPKGFQGLVVANDDRPVR
jgi:hypothetical protein